MNQLTIIGNLTKDPDLNQTNGGKDVCNFTVAVNRRQKNSDGQNEADFFRVSVWNEMAKICKQYLGKGKKVCVTGEVRIREYTTQDGTKRSAMEVTAQHVEFLTPRGEGGSSGASQSNPAPNMTPVAADDELPF